MAIIFTRRLHFSTLILSLIIFTVDLSASPPHGNTHLIYFPGQRPGQKPNQSDSKTQNANAPQQFMANVAQCAMNNETFCTKNDGYPMDHIKNLLREHANKYADAFVTDVSTNDITDRVVDRIEGLDDEYMCESYEKVIFPTTGKTQDGRDQFIINTDEFKQGVRVSMCRRAGQPCKLSEHFPNDFKSECKQQMVYRQLLSLSSSGQPIKSHFEFPACCSCVLHRA